MNSAIFKMVHNNMTTSILAGSLKGKRLETGHSLRIRPTSSRVRTSIFDIIGNLTGEKVLDLYSGAGTLGFEAISRGAESVTFVDNSDKALSVTKLNAQLFPDASLYIVQQDAVNYLSQCDVFDIILADPPYGKTDLDDLTQAALKRLTEKGLLIIESSKRENWQPDEARVKTYGETQLTIFRK